MAEIEPDRGDRRREETRDDLITGVEQTRGPFKYRHVEHGKDDSRNSQWTMRKEGLGTDPYLRSVA